MITIVLCTYNRAALLDSALSSLEAQTITCVPFEILVVDDGSTDATFEIVEAHCRRNPTLVRYVRQENRGVAAARNFGIAEARGDWVAFFDDDQIANPGWLAELYDTALQAGADCVGGPCYLALSANHKLANQPTIRRLLGENLQITAVRRGPLSRLDPRRREAIPGTGNALVKASLFRKVGKFSERSYGEDLEFFRRAERSGAKIAIARKAVVHHVVPAHRLQPEYLLKLSAKGGRTQAEVDLATGSYPRVLLRTGLRALHLCMRTVPRLLTSLMIADRAAVTARRCSKRFACAYIGAVIKKSTEPNAPLLWS